MLTDKDGNRLFRRLDVKIVFPEGLLPFRDKTFVHHAPPHKGYGPDNIQQILEAVATDLESLYPWWDFTAVELKPVGRTARWLIRYAGPNLNYKAPERSASAEATDKLLAEMKPIDFEATNNVIETPSPAAEVSHE